jgi:DNA mismatch endonuclease (patch repair protein)
MPRKIAHRRKDAAEVRRNMSAIRSSENRTEMALRHAVHALGLRYRKYASHLPGKPDFVFPLARVAVFVDGDYWHARELAEGKISTLQRRLSRLPTASRRYWWKKFRQRVVRDREVTAQLEAAGWFVIRMWESDVRLNVGRAASRIAVVVRRRAHRKD